ncbi:MAG: PilZ domain-containing protein [Planctomycetes bacterium]|nr:PilZ domain-containing protein [Planctomycetota bacterium]
MAEKNTAPKSDPGAPAGITHSEAHEACKALHAATTVQALSDAIEKQACELLDCQRATFYRVEKHNKVVNLVAYRNKGRNRVSIPLGEGIAGNVGKDNGYYICNKPAGDDLFVAAIDGIPGVDTRNLISTAMEADEEVVGVLQAMNKEGRGFEESDAFWLQLLAEHGALAYLRVKRSEDGWTLARNLAEAVATAVDNKHVSTVGHSDRTRQIALAVGREMNLDKNQLLELEFAALLHDAGRLALSPEAFEWAGGPGASSQYSAPTERLHLVLTDALLRGLKLPEYLARMPEIALAHHEMLDGSGYPRGKKGAELPLSARILAIANYFDLLTTGRAPECNGKRMEDEDAAKVLQQRAGKQFDAAIVDRMLKGKLYQIEKRRFPRYDYDTPVEVAVLGEAPGAKAQTLQTKALDLSEGGILFHSPDKLPDHALLKLKIHLPTEKLEALARVARHLKDDSGKGFKVGAYFMWYGT